MLGVWMGWEAVTAGPVPEVGSLMLRTSGGQLAGGGGVLGPKRATGPCVMLWKDLTFRSEMLALRGASQAATEICRRRPSPYNFRFMSLAGPHGLRGL